MDQLLVTLSVKQINGCENVVMIMMIMNGMNVKGVNGKLGNYCISTPGIRDGFY